MPKQSRMHSMISRARDQIGGSRNLSSIVTQLLYGPEWQATIDDPILHRQVMRLGWDHAGAEYLKRVADALEESGAISGISERQLELWPTNVRSLVQQIDRTGVFVPSAGQYLPLTPLDITQPQCIEAGNHLINHGEDSIRRGRRLIELGNLPWSTTS